ncbi:hypothetical protein G6F37_010900 [Rhizopus arrhizus]|nr:hypothetical protein G6F38_010945 [Rhizopus arrhizus]KAG1151886.1 hypothetical protein G6F37_010900 [Rhizopus arrhizus]
MPRWSYLSAEILDCIFQEDCLDESDVLQCCLVCKSWNRAANIKLYKKVAILRHSQLVQFLECMKSNQLGELVNAFYIRPSAFERKVMDYVQQLAAVCPNVQKFDCHAHFYDLWKALSSVSHWKLKRIPPPFPSENQDYYKCALRHRQTLTYLCLPEDLSADLRFHWFVRHLKEFTQLSHLVIRSSSFGQSLMDYDPIIQHARQLTSLKIGGTFGVHVSSRLPTPDLPCAEPHSEIKELEVTIKYYPGTVHYLIRKFPNLKSLTLAFEDYTIETATELQACFLEISGRFVDYLKRIHHYNVAMACTQALVSAYFKSNPNNILSFDIMSVPDDCSPLVLEPGGAMITCGLEHVKKWASPHVLSVSLSAHYTVSFRQWAQDVFTCFPHLKVLECSFHDVDPQTASFASGLSKSLQVLSLRLIDPVQKVCIDSSRFPSLQSITLDLPHVHDKTLSLDLSALSLQQLQLRLYRHVHSLQGHGEIYLQVKTNDAGVKSFTFKKEGDSFQIIRGYVATLPSLRIDISCSAIDCFSLSLGDIQLSSHQLYLK